jgi:chromosome partitioning protein
MKTVSICNQKGGVGKTSTAISLAAFLALDGIKTLIIDLDPQGNTTSGLGVDKLSVDQSVYHALMNQAKFSATLRKTFSGNLSLVPSNIDVTGVEIELVSEMGRETRLSKALNDVRSDFDVCIIDCPPSLNLLTINALAASDSIIIPIQCEFYALEGLGQLIKTIDLVKDNLNPSIEIEGILMTMADHRTNLTNQVILQVKQHFPNKIYNSIIPRSVRMAEAPSFGKPIMVYDRNCMVCMKYDEFHREFVKMNRNILKTKELEEMSHGTQQTR